ncbi:MAG TPA: hypothetical protein VKP67_29140 [Xanthobacteraceae bacterium]|nr:hypothetical protein [Xanthobacteraceae bacterium]
MRKLPLIVAAASALWAVPAFAGQVGAAANTEPVVTPVQLDFCIGPDCRRDRYYDREWRYRDRGCRDVTIRERRGDEVIVRHERRCD